MVVEELYKKLYGKLRYYSAKIVGDPEVAHEIVQDVFVVLCNLNPDQFSAIVNLDGYLYVMVRNLSLKHVKKNALSHIRYGLGYEEGENEQSTDTRMVEAEVVSALHDRIKGLPEQCRKVAEMLFLEEKSPAEVAEALHITVSAVSKHKMKAINHLNAHMSDELWRYFILLFVMERICEN